MPDVTQLVIGKNGEEYETVSIPDPTLEQVQVAKLADLASYRWDQQNKGTVIMGMSVPTDDFTQQAILGARVQVMIDNTYTVNWKTPNGFMVFDATTISAVAEGIREHIQACFDNEKIHLDAINALASVEDVLAYDFTTGWPI